MAAEFLQGNMRFKQNCREMCTLKTINWVAKLVIKNAHVVFLVQSYIDTELLVYF